MAKKFVSFNSFRDLAKTYAKQPKPKVDVITPIKPRLTRDKPVAPVRPAEPVQVRHPITDVNVYPISKSLCNDIKVGSELSDGSTVVRMKGSRMVTAKPVRVVDSVESSPIEDRLERMRLAGITPVEKEMRGKLDVQFETRSIPSITIQRWLVTWHEGVKQSQEFALKRDAETFANSLRAR